MQQDGGVRPEARYEGDAARKEVPDRDAHPRQGRGVLVARGEFDGMSREIAGVLVTGADVRGADLAEAETVLAQGRLVSAGAPL